MRLICLVCVALICFSGISSATAQIIDRHIKTACERTPSLGTSNYPGYSTLLSSNNLARPPGKSILAQGQPVYLYGRVFDKDCVPVSEAKVELWHANPEGKYRFASRAALATPDPVFAGGGRTTTDNLGQFQFITLYPGPQRYSYKKTDDETGEETFVAVRRAPHFNVRISHPDMPTFNTSLYFSGDHRNKDDSRFRRLSDQKKPLVLMFTEARGGDWNQGVQAFIDITLPRKANFRSY